MRFFCWNLLQTSHTGNQHVQYICAVNPSICASDVSDSQMALTGYQAIVQHHQPRLGLSFSFWMWRSLIVMQCSMSPPPGEFSEQRIWGFSVTLRQCRALSAALCLCVLYPPGPSTPSGLRETLAFELLSCHFLLLENREMRREHWPIQICPSIHPWICTTGWVNTPSYPYSVQDYNQAASQTLLIRQLDHQGTPTKSSGLSFKESPAANLVSSFKNKIQAAFKATPEL